MKRLFHIYIDSFRGLRIEVWWLALVTLINRAGTMVMTFMSLYLTEDLHFTLPDVGWVMSAFGAGSVLGAWLGGKLTDRFGFYPVMFWSLIMTGIAFFGIQYITSFNTFCVGIFFLMIIADTFRPAAFVAINTYSKPENRTRSVTLLRLAINLGFSLGPAAGGFIIMAFGYASLFWIDGITCIIAGLILFIALTRKQHETEEKTENKATALSPYRDKPYLLFVLIIFIIGFAFLQYFSTIPLYYRNVHFLSEEEIGWLMALNGFLIFLIEMPLIKYFEKPQFSIFRLLFYSSLLFAFSFLVLNLTSWVGVLTIGMLFMTFGEMLNFPFLNRFAMDRAENGKTGDYMALFTMAFGLAHVLGHNSGMQLVNRFGYNVTWYIMTGAMIIAALLIVWLRKLIKAEIENCQLRFHINLSSILNWLIFNELYFINPSVREYSKSFLRENSLLETPNIFGLVREIDLIFFDIDSI
ncbi:MAG: MFS transporter [Flavobacteriales bacterium]|nr:MFS transporter [Flavobacteriales bacterium]